MDWQDRLELDFEIITGDGKKWHPIWKGAKIGISSNVQAFDFININGSYVAMKSQSGKKYPFDFYFIGNDCIEVALDFNESTKNRRPWKVNHPFLGQIKVITPKLECDLNDYNVAHYTGVWLETIGRKYPRKQIDPINSVLSQKVALNEMSVVKFTGSLLTASAENVASSKKSIEIIGKGYKILATNKTRAGELQNLTKTAAGAAETISTDASGYIQQVIKLINFPTDTIAGIESKVEILKNNLSELERIFLSDSSNDKDKELYEYNSTAFLTQISSDAVNSEYENSAQILSVIENISVAYNTFIAKLDNINHVQDSELALNLSIIVNESIASLLDIALDSKQERKISIEKDSNIIVLAHKYYGAGDENLAKFVEKNNINLAKNEFLQLEKGREIIYYI